MFCGIIVIVGAAVVYSLYQRSSWVQDRLLTQAPPTGADNPFKDNNQGWVPNERYQRAEKIPVSTEQLPAQKKAEPPPEDDNGLEAHRKKAWDDYWKDVEKVRQDHFDKRKDALTNLSTAQPTTSGEKGETKTAAAEPPSHPMASSGGLNAGGWSGGLSPAAWGGGGFGGVPGYGGGFGFPGITTPQIDREGQEQKITFAGQTGDLGKNDVVPTVRKPPIPNALMAGSFVKFHTINESNSDVPGSQIGMVSEAVYNTSDGTCVLIPQGSRLIGHYNSAVSTGQDRLPGVLTRIIFPDGSSQAIGAMESADAAGSAGQEDIVNRHLAQKFGGAALAGLFGAGIYLAVPHDNNGYNNNNNAATSIIGASLAQQLGQVGQQISLQALSIPNTITIRAGYNGTMITDKDIVITPWDCPGQSRHSILPIMAVDDQ